MLQETTRLLMNKKEQDRIGSCSFYRLTRLLRMEVKPFDERV